MCNDFWVFNAINNSPYYCFLPRWLTLRHLELQSNRYCVKPKWWLETIILKSKGHTFLAGMDKGGFTDLRPELQETSDTQLLPGKILAFLLLFWTHLIWPHFHVAQYLLKKFQNNTRGLCLMVYFVYVFVCVCKGTCACVHMSVCVHVRL